MSVTVVLRGPIGNCLFQHATGRLIVEATGFALRCVARQRPFLESQPEEQATESLFIRTFPNAPLRTAGQLYQYPVEAFDIRVARHWSGHCLPLERLLTDVRARQIYLDGYFQRAEYYLPRIRMLRSWYDAGSTKNASDGEVRDVLLCIYRTPAFAARGWTLPLSYYRRALATLRTTGSIHVVTNESSQDIVESLADYAPVYHACDIVQRFRLIQSFRKVVLSNDPFDWWAAFLSDASEIIGPSSSNAAGYAYTGCGDIDLHMRQKRYREVNVPTFYNAVWRARSLMTGASLYLNGPDVIVQQRTSPLVRIPNAAGTTSVLRLLTRQSTLTQPDIQSVCPTGDVVTLLVHLERAGLLQESYVYADC